MNGTRPRTRIIRATDITSQFLARHPEGVRILIANPDHTTSIATVRGVRPARFYEDRAQLLVQIDGADSVIERLGKAHIDWIQD